MRDVDDRGAFPHRLQQRVAHYGAPWPARNSVPARRADANEAEAAGLDRSRAIDRRGAEGLSDSRHEVRRPAPARLDVETVLPGDQLQRHAWLRNARAAKSGPEIMRRQFQSEAGFRAGLMS